MTSVTGIFAAMDADEGAHAPQSRSEGVGAQRERLLPVPIPADQPELGLPALGGQEIEAARAFVDASRAASTRKAYQADWDRFCQWCRARQADPLPAAPALLAVYLSVLAASGLAPPSVARALAAIAHAHTRAGQVPPHRGPEGGVVTEALAGIRRSRPNDPGRKQPADADIVRQLLWSIEGEDLAALRDRALIAFGMALAARRSELVALDVADLAWEDQGVRVTIRRSKTDQEAAGAVVAVPEGRRLTPLTHLRAWLAAAGIAEGALFRPLWKGGRVRDTRLSDHAVARIVQARAAAAGLDPARYAGHSLRAGFVTEAARAGAAIWKIQQVSRHKSMQVLAGYVRDARLFDDHAGDTFL
ncbi:MAG: site-specific integrase [Acetobacteraceae bacterium]|nr:site-specific integrase [Acetobacteraceae bacterium]